MTLPWNLFVRNITELKKISDNIFDGWTIHGTKENSNCYISKTRRIKHKSNEETVSIEYHVVYNLSYGVPVLCFNIFTTDGSVMLAEDAWNYCEFYDTDDPKTALSQMEHPVLKRPYLTIHPCQTEQVLNVCFNESTNFVISWLSAVGHIIGLSLSTEYEILASKK